jgi:ribosome-binding protein aMBF1 (putative translation factor)
VTPDAFRAALDTIGWSQRGLADRLSCDDRMVRRWASGELTVPPSIARWLARLARCHAANPAPDDWRRRSGLALLPYAPTVVRRS